MNNLIKKLAEQAGSTHKQNLGVYQFYTHELETFTKAIVEECYGEILCQLYGNNPSTDEKFNAGHEAGLRLAVDTIKAHFEL
jgi:hypothetical protein